MLQEIGINYLSQVVEFFVYVGFFICFTHARTSFPVAFSYLIRSSGNCEKKISR